MFYLLFYTVLWWASLVLTGLSLVAMIVELCLNSVRVRFPPITFNVARRVRKTFEIVTAYRQFKMERSAFGLFIWTMWTFGVGVVLVPVVGVAHFAIFGF